MFIKRAALLLGSVIATATVLLIDVGSADSDGADDPGRQTASSDSSMSRLVFTDEARDVRRPELDIRDVRVVNRADKLKVRISFPGVKKTYDFPTGAIMVYLDTVESREGPEYGHFMDFWSDYRFAPTEDWREQRVRRWSHSPEGRCVATAGVRSDKKSRLRWFEYVVLKQDACFEADMVRVAVSSVNTGEPRPYVEYRRPVWDHLGDERAWTDWVPVTS